MTAFLAAVWALNKKYKYMPLIIVVLVMGWSADRYTSSGTGQVQVAAGATAAGTGTAASDFEFEIIPTAPPPVKPGCEEMQHCCSPCNSCCPIVKARGGSRGAGHAAAGATGTADVLPPKSPGLDLGFIVAAAIPVLPGVDLKNAGVLAMGTIGYLAPGAEWIPNTGEVKVLLGIDILKLLARKTPP